MNIGLVVSDDLDYGFDLADALVKAGISVTLYLSLAHVALYIHGTRRIEGDSQSDILVEQLFKMRLIPYGCQVRLFHYPRIRDLRSLMISQKIRKYISKDGLDVVHILMGPGELWLAVLSCLIRDLPVVSTMIIPKPNAGEQLPVMVLWAIAKLLTIGSTMVIVNGTDQVELVHALYGTPVTRVAYVPLGSRTTALRWADESCPEEQRTVLFPGKAQLRKGLEYLVKAQPSITNQIPDAKILIAAHGEDLARCRAMIKDQSKFEIHDGFMTGTLLAGFFCRASIVVLPYISASTSGLLMTAYVFGKPVVATTVGSLPEYVKDGVTGYLVPPADSEKLSQAIVKLLKDDELRHRMGENARKWAQEENLRIASETSRVYALAQSRYGKE